MTIFPFVNATGDKMSGFFMYQTDNPDEELDPINKFSIAGNTSIGMAEMWGSDMDSIA